MAPEIEQLGGMHRDTIDKLVSEGDDAVRAEVIPMIEELRDSVNQLKDALIGHTDALGNKVPGALEELNARITIYDRDRREDSRQLRVMQLHNHKTWQEGEDIRAKERSKRDEDIVKMIGSVAETLGQVVEKVDRMQVTQDQHERMLVSRFARAMQWCVETYQTGHKKYLVLAAAWASITAAVAGGVGLAMKAYEIYMRSAHIIKDAVHVLKEGLGK